MKKFAISLIALAALSTVAAARSTEFDNGYIAKGMSQTTVSQSALAVKKVMWKKTNDISGLSYQDNQNNTMSRGMN